MSAVVGTAEVMVKEIRAARIALEQAEREVQAGAVRRASAEVALARTLLRGVSEALRASISRKAAES